jgi:hypothetical protein
MVEFGGFQQENVVALTTLASSTALSCDTHLVFLSKNFYSETSQIDFVCDEIFITCITSCNYFGNIEI